MIEEKSVRAETLLKIAEQYQREGLKPYEAVELAAGELALPLLTEDSACKIYHIEDGTLANCWIG
jgi:hypothetical protein